MQTDTLRARQLADGGHLANTQGSRRSRFGLLDGHKVFYAFYAVYIAGEFGGEVPFRLRL